MATDNFNNATIARAAALDALIQAAEQVAAGEDYGDMIGSVRLVELAAEQARLAIIREARAAGDSWQRVGDALGTSRQNAQQRYGAFLVEEEHVIGTPSSAVTAEVDRWIRSGRLDRTREHGWDPLNQNLGDLA